MPVRRTARSRSHEQTDSVSPRLRDDGEGDGLLHLLDERRLEQLPTEQGSVEAGQVLRVRNECTRGPSVRGAEEAYVGLRRLAEQFVAVSVASTHLRLGVEARGL